MTIAEIEPPYLDGFIIATTEELAFEDLKAVDPSLVTLIQFAFSCFKRETSDNRVTSSNKNVFVCDDHGFYGFL